MNAGRLVCAVVFLVVPALASAAVMDQVEATPGDAPFCVVVGTSIRCEYLNQLTCIDASLAAHGVCLPHHLPGYHRVVPGAGAMPGVSPVPAPLLPGMVPLLVDLTDGPGGMASIGSKAQGAYASGRFADLDALIGVIIVPDDSIGVMTKTFGQDREAVKT